MTRVNLNIIHLCNKYISEPSQNGIFVCVFEWMTCHRIPHANSELLLFWWLMWWRLLDMMVDIMVTSLYFPSYIVNHDLDKIKFWIFTYQKYCYQIPSWEILCISGMVINSAAMVRQVFRYLIFPIFIIRYCDIWSVPNHNSIECITMFSRWFSLANEKFRWPNGWNEQANIFVVKSS